MSAVKLELMANAVGCQQQCLVQPVVYSLIIAKARARINAKSMPINWGLIASLMERFELKNQTAHLIRHKLLMILEQMRYVIGI